MSPQSPYWFEGAYDESGGIGNRAIQGAAGGIGGAIVGHYLAPMLGKDPGAGRLIGGAIGAAGSALFGPTTSRIANERRQKIFEDAVRSKVDHYAFHTEGITPNNLHVDAADRFRKATTDRVMRNIRNKFEYGIYTPKSFKTNFLPDVEAQLVGQAAALHPALYRDPELWGMKEAAVAPMANTGVPAQPVQQLSSHTFEAKLASYVASTRPDLFHKAAAEFLASQFPSLSAAFDAYSQSRQYQNALQAQQNAMNFPALHATQPAMYYANQQAMMGETPNLASAQSHHRRRHRHHG